MDPNPPLEFSLEPQEETNEVLNEIRRSKRDRREKNYGLDFVIYLVEWSRDVVFTSTMIDVNIEPDPKTYEEAIKSQDASFWKEAINDEMDSMDDMLIFGTDMDNIISTKELLSSKFDMKDMSVADVILGSGGQNMNWSKRVRVAVGSAEGLAYLHEECPTKIIHRDIKPDNILLDNHWEPKIADFGIAKILPNGNTHIDVTRVIGTPGYVDPECVSTHQFTERSDAYSFGVMILELITGREAIIRTRSSMVKLVDWARPLMNPQCYRQLVDSRLNSIYDVNEMTRMVNCAAICVGPSQRRPRMSKVQSQGADDAGLLSPRQLHHLDTRTEIDSS
ncbi:proline-rich receptor-like protein kinase PERK2 [Tasmannia lanceolata]|uniref:proline-rich receptor-like protein kinase PERK2 n=1 Tax=Tasmannia lanceolata TaxID=3420 RepID=UPI004063798C